MRSRKIECARLTMASASNLAEMANFAQELTILRKQGAIQS